MPVAPSSPGIVFTIAPASFTTTIDEDDGPPAMKNRPWA